VNIYAESSAVLAWLLGEDTALSVREVLRRAELVAASDLTLVECDRVLIRAIATGEIDEAAAADRRAHLNAAASHWHLWRVSSDIVERARHPFPAEPVRTLDAIHLASALAVRSSVPGVELLSLDDRIRRTGKQLGFHLRPERVIPARV
jgi:predicted nucleic acid-binding protein